VIPEPAGTAMASRATVKRVAREGIELGAAQVAGAAGRFATVFFLTRLMDPAAYGTLALLQGIGLLGLAIVPAALTQSVLRYHPEAAAQGATGDMRRILKPRLEKLAGAVAALAAAGIVAWLALSGKGVPPTTLVAVVAAMAIIVPDTARAYELSVLSATRAQSRFAAWTAIDALVRPVGAVAAILLAGPGSDRVLVGLLVVVLLSNRACTRAFVREPSTRTPHGEAWMREAWPRMKRYALPLAPLALFVWIVAVGDRYALAALHGRDAAGLYAAAYGIASQPFIALGQVGLTIVRPRFFSAVDSGDLRRARRVLLAVLAGVVACAIAGDALIGLLAEPLTHVCFGQRFGSTAPLLAWIGAAFAFQAAQIVLEVLVYARHRTGRLLLVQAAAAVVAGVLYAALIPRWGAWGAALATLGAYAVSCGLTAFQGDLAGLLRLSSAWRLGTSPDA